MKLADLIKQRDQLNLEIEKHKSGDFDEYESSVAYRRIRTVARAVLDLYELVGEQPRSLNELKRVAERKL
jgi:hypothetical protein